MSFRHYKFDPLLISAQIVLIQSTFYLSLSLLSLVLQLILNQPLITRVLNFEEFTTSTLNGWLIITTYYLNSIITAFLCSRIVEKSKTCLDFIATLYLYHFVLEICLFGWPNSLLWYVVIITNFMITLVIGREWTMKRELEPIMINELEMSEL